MVAARALCNARGGPSWNLKVRLAASEVAAAKSPENLRGTNHKKKKEGEDLLFANL